METSKQAQIATHARAIAALLYEETDREQVQTLAGIEEVVRSHLLEHVSPEIAIFLSTRAAPQPSVESVASTALSES